MIRRHTAIMITGASRDPCNVLSSSELLPQTCWCLCSVAFAVIPASTHYDSLQMPPIARRSRSRNARPRITCHLKTLLAMKTKGQRNVQSCCNQRISRTSESIYYMWLLCARMTSIDGALAVRGTSSCTSVHDVTSQGCSQACDLDTRHL